MESKIKKGHPVRRQVKDCAPANFPEGSMLALLRRISQEFMLHGQKWKLPPNVGLTLMRLHMNPADSEPASLAKANYFPRQTMTFILDAMEKQGLAIRRRIPTTGVANLSRLPPKAAGWPKPFFRTCFNSKPPPSSPLTGSIWMPSSLF